MIGYDTTPSIQTWDTLRGNWIGLQKDHAWSTLSLNITDNVQYVTYNAHLNLIRGIFSNKPSLIAEMENSTFLEQKVLN